MLAGNDNISDNSWKQNRNLNFVSRFIEITEKMQFPLFSYKASGFNFFPSAGIGILYFNPKTLYKGSWQSLQPLSTEGQGLPGGPKPYSRYTAIFPLGMECSYFFKRFAVAIDAYYTITLSDYIDDTSFLYFDNNEIRVKKGTAAAELADPSLGITQKKPIAAGQPRGNPETKDGYIIIALLIQYKF